MCHINQYDQGEQGQPQPEPQADPNARYRVRRCGAFKAWLEVKWRTNGDNGGIVWHDEPERATLFNAANAEIFADYFRATTRLALDKQAMGS
jgi:hypothetical protein